MVSNVFKIMEIELMEEGSQTIIDLHEPEKAFDDDNASEWLTTGDPSSETVYLGFNSA